MNFFIIMMLFIIGILFLEKNTNSVNGEETNFHSPFSSFTISSNYLIEGNIYNINSESWELTVKVFNPPFGVNYVKSQ